MKKITTLTLALLTLFAMYGQGFRTFDVEGQLLPTLIKNNSKGTSLVEVITDGSVDLENVDFKYKLYSGSSVVNDISSDFTEPQLITVTKRGEDEKVWELKVKPLVAEKLPFKLSFSKDNLSIWSPSVVGWAGIGVDEEKNTVIRFGNEGVSFLVAFEGDANSVSYELSPVSKELVNFDGVFHVETSANGKDWKAIHTFDKRNNFDTSNMYTHPIESGVRYIKWTYNKRNKLNINLNNIEIVPAV